VQRAVSQKMSAQKARVQGTRQRPRRRVSIAIDDAHCKACGICVALCSRQVLERDHLGLPLVAHPDDCTACMLCDWHCPDFAIEVTRHDEPAAQTDDERQAVTTAVKTAHKLSRSRRELPPDAEPGSSTDD
jgi:2-oxoglutarate ferredoxin oxidoreductase subunit delta